MATRYERLDALRGIAMLWMTLFHLCFDLSYFGWWPQDFRTDSFWTIQRNLIVSLFLFCAGCGQAAAWHARANTQRFTMRWCQIVACAALVSIGSFILFPRSFIYFGILHGMAVMLLLIRPLRRTGQILWWLGLLALLSPKAADWLLTGPLSAYADVFNGRALNWLGWVTRKPYTEDYVPLFPWFGLLCWGVASGQWLLARRPAWLAKPLGKGVQPLATLGRYSLSYYMLHQPVMLGIMGGVQFLT